MAVQEDFASFGRGPFAQSLDEIPGGPLVRTEGEEGKKKASTSPSAAVFSSLSVKRQLREEEGGGKH